VRGRRALAAAAILLAASIAWARSPGQRALDDGVALYKKGNYREARDQFRAAVDLDPALTKAWENLGWANHRLGEDAEALRIWKTVLKIEPDNVGAWNAVGEVQYAKGVWAEAAKAFEKSLALFGKQPDVCLRLGQTYEKLGRGPAAAEQYRLVLKDRPHDPDASLRLAGVYERDGRLEQAEQLLRTASRDGDGDGAVAKRLAHVLAAQGDEAYAREAWTTAIDRYGEASQLDPERTIYLVNLGWALRKSGASREAIAAWRRALVQKPMAPADVWRALGDAFQESGRIDDATAAYARAAEADPRDAASLYALAEINFRAGDVERGIDALRRMFATADAGEKDAVRTADLLIREQETVRGGRMIEEVAASSSRTLIANIALARVRAAQGGEAYRAGDYEVALAFYGQALRADPKNRAALRDMGWTQWRRGDWSGVRRTWTSYMNAYPALAEPHDLLGRLELHNGDYERAIDRANEALRIEPGAMGPQILIVRAHLAGGKIRQGRERAARLAADHPDDLAVQTLYGDALWRSLDFAASRDQWRKVLDMSGSTPRAMHYWLRSMYELGEYDAAIDAATTLAATRKAPEPVLRLLAEDAQVRSDFKATARWYGELVRRFPERVPYWEALAETYRDGGDPRRERQVLKDGIKRHPEANQLRLMMASAVLAAGRPKRAMAVYRELAKKTGRNRSIFDGQLQSQVALGRYGEALASLDAGGAQYMDDDERALTKASILEEAGRRPEAAAARRRVIARHDGTVTVPILLYHGIADHPRSVNAPLANFESQMRAIRDAGFTSITVTDLDGMMSGRRAFPDKPILITFDDARADSFRFADPVLKRLGLRATMFVPTVRIADESAFNTDWKTLSRLYATGRWDFQAHGHLAHDPIPIDEEGHIAEFLVNREWLQDQRRQETYDEFEDRVASDYATCSELLTRHLPGQKVIGYAFPFSEMGQLRGGNEPNALAVNEEAFRRLHRYGFIQDEAGYNALAPGAPTPRLLYRLNVPRTWDGTRLLAHLSAAAPSQQAKLDGARAHLWNAKLDSAESELRTMIAADPRIDYEAGVDLTRTLHEQGRDFAARRTYEALPEGPGWPRPDGSTRRLERDVAWNTSPQTGFNVRVVSDSDGRDSFAAPITGRYAAKVPIVLSGAVGPVEFKDAVLPSLSGFDLTLGADWTAGAHVSVEGWIRGRDLDGGLRSLNGELGIAGRTQGHRYGLTCGVVDVDTVGALEQGIERRLCDVDYRTNGLRWRAHARAEYQNLTDGNEIWGAFADGTYRPPGIYHVEYGGRFEAANSLFASPFYYAPLGLVTALGLVRYVREFPSGAAIDAELGAGPSRDDVAGLRIVGRVHAGWTQNWSARWRTTLALEYGATPDYHRTTASFSLGYRF
jgi:tetratricopeptide (TPR) repeat protein